jgi:hypothetical protein
MMVAARTSETSADYFTQQYIPEDKSELGKRCWFDPEIGGNTTLRNAGNNLENQMALQCSYQYRYLYLVNLRS